MTKPKTARIILKGWDGKLYRFCHVADFDDKRKDPYFKLMFPALAKGSTFEQKVGYRDKDGSIHKTKKTTKQVKGNISEISYHYSAGVVTLKDANQQHPSRKRFPKLQFTDAPVLVCRCALIDMSLCKLVNNSEEGDIVLDRFRFPAEIGFYVANHKKNKNFTFIDHLDGNSYKFVSATDERTTLTVTVMEWKDGEASGNAIHINNDPFAWITDAFWTKLWVKLKWRLRSLFRIR